LFSTTVLSTGGTGESNIIPEEVDLETGKVLQQTDLDDDFFRRGATVLNGKIYQLTGGKNGSSTTRKQQNE